MLRTDIVGSNGGVSGMLCHIGWYVNTDVSKGRTTSTLRITQLPDCLPLKAKTLPSY